jgi:hypothetical protein
MRDLPPHEQLSVSTDLPRIERWIDEHPEAGAEVAVDRAAFDSNMGHVLLVVAVREQQHLESARRELVELVEYADRLRVRPWRPAAADAERAMRWIMEQRVGQPRADRTSVSGIGINPRTGFVEVSLNRHDPQYADELVGRFPGIVVVNPEPVVFRPANHV